MPFISPHTILIIPAYNEERSLPSLLDSLDCFRNKTLIVDDNSEDDTIEIIKRKGFSHIVNSQKKGTSGCILTGLYYAFSKGIKYAITLDADGQHDPTYIEEFEKAVEKGCFVCGNRFSNLAYIPSNKITSNCFASKMVKQYFNIIIPDIACGYRAFNIQKYLNLATEFAFNDFELIYYFIFHAINTNDKIKEIPIPSIYYPEDLWDTPRTEITSLIMSIYRYKQDEGLIYIKQKLDERYSFECSVDNTLFFFHYLNSSDSYFIEADLKDIFSYYMDNPFNI